MKIAKIKTLSFFVEVWLSSRLLRGLDLRDVFCWLIRREGGDGGGDGGGHKLMLIMILPRLPVKKLNPLLGEHVAQANEGNKHTVFFFIGPCWYRIRHVPQVRAVCGCVGEVRVGA